MSALNHLAGGHLVHLVLLAPAAFFGIGVWVFARRRPTWDPPRAAAATRTAVDAIPGDSTAEHSTADGSTAEHSTGVAELRDNTTPDDSSPG